MRSSRRRGPGRGPRAASALIITLAIVALLTSVIVAFFSFSTKNMTIETSRADRKRAELLASSACSYVAAQFLQELATNSAPHAAGTSVTNYFPLSPTNAAPARFLSPAISATDANYANLIRQSVAATDPRASGDSTSLAAANGRTVTLDRWNRSALLGGTGLTSAQVPSWTYVDRANGATNSGSPSALGRFAYNVYDIGGLLNVNAAGVPAVLSAQQASLLKGEPAGADLTQLPGVTAADVAALLSFRSAGTASSAANYPLTAQGAARSGFLSAFFTNTAPLSGGTTYTNNYFFSRQDLLRYAQSQVPDLTNALPCLTTFSRHLTGPSWAPSYLASSTINYTNLATVSGSTNRAVLDVRFAAGHSLPHYLDDGTTQPCAVSAGDALMQRRFSLAKLAWLTSQGPAAGISAAAIKDCFGLTWNRSTESWAYQDAAIKTLDQVAALVPPREPNFFETLKAGILIGSVGCASANKTFDNGAGAQTPKQAYDANADLQILRIGADIADCAKSDNYPTTVTLSGIPVHGVQDLPYLYGVLNTVLCSPATAGPNANTTMSWASLVLVPLLFNPHQAPAAPVAAAPAQLRMEILSGASVSTLYLSSFSVAPRSPTDAGSMYATANADLSRDPAIVFPMSSADLFRSGPAPVSNATSSTSLTQLVPNAADVSSAFVVYTWPTHTPLNNTSLGVLRANVKSILITLEALSPSNQWRVYDTLIGNEIDTSSGIGGATGVSLDNYPSETFVTRTSVASGSSVILKIDPRTTRYGLSFGESFTTASNPATGTGLIARLPFGSGNLTGTGMLPGLWAQGGTNTWADANGTANTDAADRDGVVRPADGALGASGTTPGPANLFSSMGTISNPARPALLHRPFQNVAELGYVFRDSPWKSLNFFDPSSGDGALLDLFSVTDEPAVASGRVSLYTRQPKVIQAVLSGTSLNPPAATSAVLPAPDAVAAALGGAVTSYVMGANGNPVSGAPSNLAQLPGFMASAALSSALSAATYPIQYQREAVLRALEGSFQTRTWNLLIDVVAQAGEFPSGTTQGNRFQVDGEKHYWLSIAIDRYTGKIVDQQLEPVDE